MSAEFVPIVTQHDTEQTSRAASAREASMGSAIRLAAEIVVRVSSIIATLWLTRSMGVETFGTFVLALSIGLIVAELCDLGLNAIVVPLLVRGPRNLRIIYVMKAAMTGGVIAASALLIPLAAWGSGLPVSVIALCTLHFLGGTWIEMTGTALRGLGRRGQEAALLLVFRFALLGLVIGAPFGMTLSGASLAYAIAVVPASILALLLIAARWRSVGDTGTAVSIAAIVRQAAPMGANSYLAIFSTRVELFLLQTFAGAHVVGLFGGALRIVESLLTLPAAIAAGALPSVARDAVRGSRGAAQRMLGLVIWLAVPSAVGLALCAPGVLSILGPGFVEGAPALRVLSLALLLCFSNAALFHILIAVGETAVIPRFTAMRVGAAVALGLLTVPALGLVGAALSFTAAELTLFVALVRRARTHAAIEVGRPITSAFVASLPMAALLLWWPLSLPASIVFGALLFALTALVMLRRGAEANGLA